MEYKNILITGGCGFVGSNIAHTLKTKFPHLAVTSLDNFSRLGSRLNEKRLIEAHVAVIEGDVRNRESMLSLTGFDLIIDCAAEPSVLAGREGNPLYVTDVNLCGTLHILELARLLRAHVIFLSSSRVYPVDLLQALPLEEKETRLALPENFSAEGISQEGVAENFPLGTHRTLYGATKLASELFVREYISNFGVKAVINRFGVIAGPWQFGKVDQGFVTLWLSKYIFGGSLSYIGFGGKGKQVRDVLHVDDLCDAIILEMNDLEACSGKTYNIGGGKEQSMSLAEMTTACERLTGITISVGSILENRPGDIPFYSTDATQFKRDFNWMPKRTIQDILVDTRTWMVAHKEALQKIFN